MTKKLSIYQHVLIKKRVTPKNLLRPHPSPKNSPIGPQKAQNDPKMAKNKKVRKEKKSCKIKAISLNE